MDQPTFKEKAKSISAEVWSFCRNLAKEFVDKGCQKNAAALTYMTLFALVPMMTVIYSMFSVIPAFNGVADQLNDLVFNNFVPETGDQVKGYLADFSTQARNLTGAGVLMLVVTAYLMLTNIEKTFNHIWGVKQARKGLSSFLLYWAVLSIGPLMLGAGLMISTYLLSLKIMVQEYDQLGVATELFRLIPLIMTTTTFTLLFAAVPNCRVPMKYAFIGGFVTALCFELLKFGFASLVSNSSFKLIYGAFAVVPLFLLWINFLWMTVLVGAVFVRTLSEQSSISRNRTLSDVRAVLQCLSMFREKAQTGSKVSDKDCLNSGVMSLVRWQKLRELLVSQRWIAVTDSGNYTLCRDLGSVTVWDAASLVQMPLDEPIPDEGRISVDAHVSEWIGDFLKRRKDIEEFAKQGFDVSLESLFAQTQGHPG